MPDRCCIPECRAISNKQNGKISVFRIPKNPTTRVKWLKSIGKKDWDPGSRAVICERHFEPSCISKRENYLDKTGSVKVAQRARPVLVAGSLPTIFEALKPVLPPPMVPQRKMKVRKRRKRKLLEKRKSNVGKKARKQKKSRQIDSMPLQQRLTFKDDTPQEETSAPTLKSQPLSPTKLKVTRHSASKPQQNHDRAQTSTNGVIQLKWNTHHSNMQTAFPNLLSKEQYCDVTLVAEGKSLKCHKLILCSCSSYFDQVLENIMPYQHPVIFIKDVPFVILKALCDFMYAGEVNIQQTDLDGLLAVAESLQVKGLANKSSVDTSTIPQQKENDQQPTAKEATQKTTKATAKSSSFEKKNSSKNGEVTDPLDLMEPTYEEAANPDVLPPVPKKNEQTRKSSGKRVRKRKHIEDDHEPSPPIFRTRKGTRSRPNIKVPRYFNASFDNSLDKPPAENPEVPPPVPVAESSCFDPLLDTLEEIKTEPIDIDDGHLSFGEETYDETLSDLPENPEYNQGPSFPKKSKPTFGPGARLTVTKQEKEDGPPDPLHVDGGEERRKENEGNSTSVNNNGEEIPDTIGDDEQQVGLVNSCTLNHVETQENLPIADSSTESHLESTHERTSTEVDEGTISQSEVDETTSQADSSSAVELGEQTIETTPIDNTSSVQIDTTEENKTI